MKNRCFIFKKLYTYAARKGKICLLYLLLIQPSFTVFSQDSPYYQLPQNRKKGHELITMPNLNTFTITYFIAASAAIKKPFLGENMSSPSKTESVAQSEVVWDVTFGQNRNDNWIFEIGLVKFNSYLSTSFLELSRNPLTFRNQTKQFYCPFRVKKRILTLDKVSRAAFLNIGLGASYVVLNKQKTSEQDRINFNQRPIPDPRDYTSLEFDIGSSKHPFAIEFLTEVRGKVSERLEITAFGKAFIRPNKYLNNQFIFNYVDQSSRNFGVYEKPVSLHFGIQAKLNSPKYYRYKSKVD